MDKSWMMESKYSENYVVGVSTFMKFVKSNMGPKCKIRCPCRECINVCYRSQNEVEDHLLLKGISESYTKWVYQGGQFGFIVRGDTSYKEISHNLRHNLDVMHIEKNICDNILGTILNIEGKTKYNLSVRLDLKDMKIKKELHLKKLEDEVSDELFSLDYGPNKHAQTYTCCIVNGVRFHAKARDEHLTSQNSGVTVEGNHKKNQINFYGVLIDIIQLNYIKDYKVVLFKCNRFDLSYKKRRLHKDEMQVVENDEVFDVDEEFETYDCNTKMQISESTSLHKEDIVANTINCEIVDNVNVLIDSDQESEDDNEGG
ncbi:hypothetical protein GQ457_06G007590 [Hibiscus cannabinus]